MANRIVLIGAPGSHRHDFALQLRERLDYPAITKVEASLPGEIDSEHPAVGAYADYRFELELATRRNKVMLEQPENDITIYADSLLDSLAHVGTIAANLQVRRPGEPQTTLWGCLTAILLAMVRDTWRADVALYLPVELDDENKPFESDVSRSLDDLIELYGIEPVRLSGEWEADLDLAERSIREAMDRQDSEDSGGSEVVREPSEPDAR